MKVTISYQVDLEDIPKTISELLGNLKENDIPLITIDIQDAMSYNNEKNIGGALESIDQARIKLAKFDNHLKGYANILAGYTKTDTDLKLGITDDYDPEGVPSNQTQEVRAENILAEENQIND